MTQLRYVVPVPRWGQGLLRGHFGGHPAELDAAARERLVAVMHQPEIALTVALNGPGEETVIYFSDLTHDYVTLNAEYST